MEEVLKRETTRSRWLVALGAAVVLVAWYVVIGDKSGIPWLMVSLAVVPAGVLLKARDWRHMPTADRVAWREALIVFLGVSVLGFALSNFHRPAEWDEPYRMASTLSIPFAWMTYRQASGDKQNYWLLIGGMLGVTTLWLIAGMLFVW